MRRHQQPKVEVGNGKGFTVHFAGQAIFIAQVAMAMCRPITAISFRPCARQSQPLDQFLIRSARPIIEGKATDYFDTRFMVDFGRGQTTLLDAYGNFHPLPGYELS